MAEAVGGKESMPTTIRNNRDLSSWNERYRYNSDGSLRDITTTISPDRSTPVETILVNGPNDRTLRPPGSFRAPTTWRRFHSISELVPSQVTYLDTQGKISYVDHQTGFYPSTNYATLPDQFSLTQGTVAMSSNIKNRLEVEALNKFRDQKIHIGNALGESRSTIAMVVTRTGKLVQIMAAAKRGKWNSVRRLLGVSGKHVASSKRFADNWLEYSFGWAPLMGDIQGGIEEFQRGIRRQDQILSAIRVFTEDSELPYQKPTYGRSWSQHKVPIRHTVKLYARIENETLLWLSSVGLLNPLETAWELTPWSFAVDWVLPVGDYLQALSAPAGLEFLGGYRSSYAKGNVVSECVSSRGSDISRYRGTFKVSTSVHAYQRDHYSSFPFPKLYIKNPFTSLSRLGNMSALLRQLWR